MRIYVNGESRDIPEEFSAEDLIASLGLTGRRLALEVNLDIVPRGEFGRFRFGADDRVEIVHAIGGG